MSRENALCAIFSGTVGKGYHLGSAEAFWGGFGGGLKTTVSEHSEGGFGFAGKRLASKRQPIHSGPAKPTAFSSFSEFNDWSQNESW